MCDNKRDMGEHMKKISYLLIFPFLALSLSACDWGYHEEVEDLTSLGVIGTFPASNNWTTEVPLIKNAEDIWEVSIEADAGNVFKIQANGVDKYSWDFSSITSETEGILTNLDGNACAVADGTYTISIVAPEKLSLSSSTLTSFEVVFDDGTITYGTDYYNDYYDDINTWENSEDLKSKLYTILHTGYNAIPYASPTNWETNQFADQALDDFEKVDVVYDTTNQDKTDTYSSGNGWQREHAFAASLMTGKLTSEATGTLGRATDFHNLFASTSNGNGSRGNKNFGIANTESEFYGTGPATSDYTYDDKNFEPGDYDKGRLARAIFYMGVMYSVSENPAYQPLTIQEEYVSYVTNVAPYAIGNLSTLLSWNDFAVDRLEYQHNESVYSHIYSGAAKAQGNRNPFVDYPELVDYVFGDKKDESGSLTCLKPSYLDLEIDKGTEIANYALSNAKRNYAVGETFSKADYTLVEVTKDFTVRPNTSFTDNTTDYTFLATDIGTKAFDIITPKNAINLPIKVADPDPMHACNYNYPLTGKASGGDLSSFTRGGNANFGGTLWKIDWTNTEAVIGNKDSKIGVAFGTSTKSVNSLTIETTTSLNVNAFYAKIYCASGKTITYTMKIGDTTIASGTVTHPSGVDVPATVGARVETPLSGILMLTINGSGATNGAVYIHSLAYDLVQ
jgi:endonuclease I